VAAGVAYCRSAGHAPPPSDATACMLRHDLNDKGNAEQRRLRTVALRRLPIYVLECTSARCGRTTGGPMPVRRTRYRPHSLVHGEAQMNQRRITTLVALRAIVTTTLAVAKTPPTSDGTAPSAASSPAQRAATANSTTESPITNGTDPSAASTPHQNLVTAGVATSHQQMKDCMTKEKARDSSVSKDQMKKTCREQAKISRN
jgi:hypothetical protein